MAPSPIYTFGPFRLDPTERLLLRDGQPVPLTPRAFEMLLVLVRESGHVVHKDKLLKEVWPDAFVEEGNLTVHMSAVRRALGEVADQAAYIETVPKRGYRFVAPVEVVVTPSRTMVIERHKETHIVREEIVEETSAPLGLHWRTLAIAATVMLVIVSGLASWRFAHSRTVPPVAPLRVTKFVSYPTGVAMPTFAPDGERVAFAWSGPEGKNWDIYVKNIGNDPPLRLTTAETSEGYPAWSPDGRQVAYIRDDGPTNTGIYLVGTLGGPERKLLALPDSRYFDLKWSGRTIACAMKTKPNISWGDFRSLSVFLFDVDSLKTRQLTFPDESEGDDRFSFSPEGTTLAFVRHHDLGTLTASSIWAVPIAGGTPRKIYEERSWIGYAVWSGDGRSIVFSSTREGGSRLYRVAAEGGPAEPLPFAEDNASAPAVWRGRLAYVRHYEDLDLWRMDLGGMQKERPTNGPFLSTQQEETSAEFSPDGRRVAYLSTSTGRSEIWVANADGSGGAPLTDSYVNIATAPSWSPDGKELVFASSVGPGNSTGGVFVIHTETRQVRQLAGDGYFSPSWSRDGKTIYVTSALKRELYDLWRIPAQGGTPVRLTFNGGLAAQESTDGKYLYYTKGAGGLWQLPLSGGAEVQILAEPAAGFRTYWRVGPKGIFYLKGDIAAPGDPPELHFYDFASNRSGRIAILPGKPPGYSGGLTVSPDGKRVIFSKVSRTGDDIILIENFRLP